MGLDDSFKKPGAVPFKWEIKPGVPKPQHQQCHHHHNHSPSSSPKLKSLLSSPKLKPPPSRSYVFSPEDPWTRSLRSTPIRSDRWQFNRSNSLPSSCFLSPLLRRVPSGKVSRKSMVEANYGWDLQRSLSLRKCHSPFCDLMSSSSSTSSNQSSPRPVRSIGWAGLGPLFFSFITGDSD